MKAKLIKHGYDYAIIQNDKMVAFSSDDYTNDHLIGKLSKQNCDEIFGVVDVENPHKRRLMKGIVAQLPLLQAALSQGWEEGFNKAMELNKDKLFTADDMINFSSWRSKRSYLDNHYIPSDQLELWFDSLDTAEIEVEIVMGDSIGISDLYTPDNKPKLDSEGCLILKKI